MATSPSEGVSVRTVRLKVLYTFDVDQKDNHLARWPQSLDVQAAYVDETNQIGVIDLRTCLEAVITASPEMTANPDNDYTVYAYDYSEPDTPLVGQGMLSKTVAGQEQAAGSDGEAMVTGRITKNVMGLFSRNAQETLEVKLRLRPVNTYFQRNRSGSISSQDGVRPWGAGSGGQYTRSGSPVDTTGLENMQRMLNGENLPIPGQPSRPGTPTGTQAFSAPSRQAGVQSRPSSRAGMRQVSHSRRDSFNSGYYSGEENMEEGPARKRAKITKVDWPSKSNLNIERQPDSLRVAASTASSVRLHRPVPINPGVSQVAAAAEDPVRPPTPIPVNKSGKPRGRVGRPRKNAPSNLAQGAQVRESSPALDSASHLELLNIPITSPEEIRGRSVSSTPANIPSSPPVMPDQPAITSPALPPLAGHDSGFMSGNLDDLFGDDQLLHFEDFIMDKPEETDVAEGAVQVRPADGSEYPIVFEDDYDFGEMAAEAPKPEMVPPPLPPPAASRPLARAQSYTAASRASMSSPRLAPAPVPRARQIMEERREQQRLKPIAPALVPKSDPAPRYIHRAQTWAPDSDAIMSDAFGMDESKTKAATKKKVGLEQTKARLENAIAKGEMPPFCDNCGSIETPAWRRAYVKVFHSGWDQIETSLTTGECCYKEILETSADGSVKTFRGYKVEKRAGDEEDKWTAIILCNPCGLWFHKQRCPRPREKWQKKDPKEKGKRKRNNAAKDPKKGNANSNLKSDAQTPASDDSSPDTATEAPDAEENDNEMSNNELPMDESEPQLPSMPRTFRASSAGPGPRGLQARQHRRPAGRQVQSSPGHRNGSEGLPIEIDLTPRPIRRQLFPSPDKPQVQSDPSLYTTAAKHVTHLPAFVRRSPRLNKTRDVFATQPGSVAITVDGKENAEPAAAVVDDGLAGLFEEGPTDVELPPPMTPQRRSERLLLKTPSKSPQRQFGAEMSPNADLLPNFRTPRSKQRHHPATTTLTISKSVLEMTPFTRSIHDAILSDAPFITNVPGEEKTSDAAETKKTRPKEAISFDFPDLPSLKNSSPMSAEQLLNFNFSEMTTDRLDSDFVDPFATTGMLPSSPPAGLFDFPNADHCIDDMWYSMVDSNAGESYPDSSAAAMVTPGQTLRRSPRSQKVK
ncbi:hypothetical protein RBB50_004639 [Rhinocladiella similis]